ncbi:AraC family transcriptional regulator [Paenibacillus athensensis]|nr:AraC family transcriptional regulator [Paenibacillus athensensis]MCD1260148.1 AraC family transcriptional regulator [Paenibacillus athensensis]
MEWLLRMKDAIDLIESSMEERLDIERIAQVAYSSPFHFQRMFHMLTGMTVADYTRKRKLTLAAQELAMTSAKVIDVALKYGYDSPESFAKAFRKVHGITPSEARRAGVALKAFPRISFQLSVKGDKNMDYRIVDKEAFPVVGRGLTVTCQDGDNLRRIPLFWQECGSDGTVAKLGALSANGLLLGLCLDMQPGRDDFTYMIAAEPGQDSPVDGYETRQVPASTWAVFTARGALPHSIQDLMPRIFQEWFPATGYEHSGAPEMEVYPQGDTTAEDYECEIWIPVVKK